MKRHIFLRKVVIAFFITAIALALFIIVANLIVMVPSNGKIFSLTNSEIPTDADTIIVLGCGVKRNGEPSDMLYDRLKTASMVAALCPDAKVLLTGDHHRENYDEIAVMKRVIIELGVDESRLDYDGYGLNTYDSMFRAASMYDVHKAIIITQRFHLPRAIYTACNYGIDAYGVEADIRSYLGIVYNNMRELPARTKDLIINMLRTNPTMGNSVSPDANKSG
jgi:vancomycin permeability regulator SanA